MRFVLFDREAPRGSTLYFPSPRQRLLENAQDRSVLYHQNIREVFLALRDAAVVARLIFHRDQAVGASLAFGLDVDVTTRGVDRL